MATLSTSQYNNIQVETITDPDPITLGYTINDSVIGTNLIENEYEITPITGTNDFGALTFGSAFNKELFYLYVTVDGVVKNPSLHGRKAIELSILSTDTVNEIAVKLNELINMKLNRYFTSTIALNVVTIKCIERGPAEAIKDGSSTTYNWTDLGNTNMKRVSGFIYVRRDAGEMMIKEKQYISLITNFEDNGTILSY